MRRRIPYRVCSCTPDGVVTHLEARLLRQMVRSAIHPIRCAASCKVKYQKGMRIGDLCAETGHFRWAMNVWSFTECQIEEKDWEVGVVFDEAEFGGFGKEVAEVAVAAVGDEGDEER